MHGVLYASLASRSHVKAAFGIQLCRLRQPGRLDTMSYAGAFLSPGGFTNALKTFCAVKCCQFCCQ